MVRPRGITIIIWVTCTYTSYGTGTGVTTILTHRSLLRCIESSADAEFDSAHIGVWMVRVCTSEEQCWYRFREVPEMALRSVPRSIALSLEVLVDLDDVE